MIRLDCSDSGCPVVRSLKVTVDPVIGSVSVTGFAFPALSCQVWKCMVSVGPILSRIRNTSGLVTSVPAKDRSWAALSPNAICCFRAEETAKCSSGFFQQAGNPDQNHRANKCHNDGADHAAAVPYA